MDTLNIFYEEPDPDRWFRFDRFPRRLIRTLLRGKQRPGGVMMVALELMRGLEKINVPYRFNDYVYIKKHPGEIACIIGKPHVLDKFKWKNPIIFGAGIFSHPIESPDFFEKYPTVKKVLVPGPWMKDIFTPFYGAEQVDYWPVGIDTEKWSPVIKNTSPSVDFLIYDKIRWRHEEFESTLISPIHQQLNAQNLSFETLTYGSYTHDELLTKLARCKAVIFLCEHETQGLAYQQILSTGTPVLAWDRGGPWQDPYYYPHKVIVGPVTSVPYWDHRCGEKFMDYNDFKKKLSVFLRKSEHNQFSPRSYIQETLTLEKCASDYYNIYTQVKSTLK